MNNVTFHDTSISPVFKYEVYFDNYNQYTLNPTLKMYKELKINNFVINCDKINDKYVILSSNQIADVLQIILNEDKCITLNIHTFNDISPMYINPLPSDISGVYYVNTLVKSKPNFINFSCVVNKCFFFFYYIIVNITFINIY